MDPFEFPSDFAALPDDELGALLDAAVAAFDACSASTSISQDDLVEMRAIAAGVADIRAEQTRRQERRALSPAPVRDTDRQDPDHHLLAQPWLFLADTPFRVT
ncbi:hypothetical protein ACFV1L_21285 [Kitasatospora sp. NPDC059646]|uniref:hypothetical protein n=1 Tax=Kitasatospora sp. NPDC059646 TaxID=3346893 RepID=UPI00369BF644